MVDMKALCFIDILITPASAFINTAERGQLQDPIVCC